MESEAVRQLVQQIEKSAPVVWEAAYRQVHLEAMELIAGIIILTILLIVCLVVSLWLDDAENKTYLRIGSIVVYLVILCPITFSMIDRIYNPTWQAVEQIKGLIR